LLLTVSTKDKPYRNSAVRPPTGVPPPPASASIWVKKSGHVTSQNT
jgi:hypothetical protein